MFSRVVKAWSVTALAFLISSVSLAQTTALGVEKLISVGGLPESFLNQKLPRVYDVGISAWDYSDATGAGNLQYETLLNQGLAFYHVFHYVDATKAFHQAMALEPQAVLPRLGLALSIIKLGNDQNAVLVAYREFQNAQILMQNLNLSEAEVFWVEFVGAYLESLLGINLSRMNQTPPQEVFANYSNKAIDLEYLVLGTNMMSDLNQLPMPKIKENYKKALQIEPKHAGAVHYLTHVAEALDERDEAVEYGRLIALYSKESAHAQHMYGHNLPIIGDWAQAEKQFTKADIIHKNWSAENQVPLTYDWHYTHNLFLWGFAQVGAGLDTEKALATMEEACETMVSHCPTMFYAIAAYGDIAKLKQVIKVLRNAGQAQQADFFQETIYWLRLDRGRADSLRAQYSDPSSGFMYVINEMLEGRDISDSLLTQVQDALVAQLTRAGFDSWSHVLPMAMLLDGVAKRQGNTKVQSVISSVYKQINFQPKR